jgi:serine/threonine-protein kinase
LLERQQRALTEHYLAPALAELEASRASGESAALLDARIALYHRDFAQAERRARAIAEHAPGSAEARQIAAEAAYGAATEALDHGNYDVATQQIEHATTTYADASEVARSDPSLYEAAARAWLQRAEIDLRQNRRWDTALRRALDLLDDHALRADPDNVAAYTTKAYVLLRWYRADQPPYLADQEKLLADMGQAAERAVAIAPGDAHAWTALGNADQYRGRYQQYHGGHGIPLLRRAVDAIDRALTLEPDDPKANNDLGATHRWLGMMLEESGADPRPEYQAAVQSYRRASEIDPQYLAPCINLIDIETTLGEWEAAHGHDPQPSIALALSAGNHCLTINANYAPVFDRLAAAQLALASYLVRGGDPEPALGGARRYVLQSEKLAPGGHDIWFDRLVAARIEAAYRLRERADPASSIATAREALSAALQLTPRSPFVYIEAARLDLVEAARARDGAAAALAGALVEAEKAMVLDDRLVDAKLVAAEVCLESARQEP